jgi:hypothetical protein
MIALLTVASAVTLAVLDVLTFWPPPVWLEDGTYEGLFDWYRWILLAQGVAFILYGIVVNFSRRTYWAVALIFSGTAQIGWVVTWDSPSPMSPGLMILLSAIFLLCAGLLMVSNMKRTAGVGRRAGRRE